MLEPSFAAPANAVRLEPHGHGGPRDGHGRRRPAGAERSPAARTLVAYGRYAATRVGQASIIYVGEGLNASVAVSELSNGVRNYHNAGKVQARASRRTCAPAYARPPTTLIPEHPRKVLVIGAARRDRRAVSTDPTVEHETIAEIEPLVPRSSPRTFSQHNFDVIRNPKVRVRSTMRDISSRRRREVRCGDIGSARIHG